MKLRLLRLLSLMLALCLAAPMALAEDVMQEPEILEELNGMPDELFTLNGTFYAQTWNQMYRKVEGGWQQLPNIFKDASVAALALTEEGLYMLSRRREVFDEKTQTWGLPDGSMFALYLLPADQIDQPESAQHLCDVSWDIQESDYPQFHGMQVIGGSAYVLLNDNTGDWERNDLVGIDLQSGKGTKILKDYLLCLTPYKNGLMLARRYKFDEYIDNSYTTRPPQLVSLNPATGEMIELAELPNSNSGALVYDAQSDVVYVSDTSFVYRYDSAFSAAEPVGYMVGGMSHSDMAATVYEGRYYVCDWQDGAGMVSAAIDPSLLPTRTLRISNVWYVDELVRSFAKEHPEIAVEYVDYSSSSADELRRHMESPQGADIYALYIPYSPYAPLLKYGLLTDLSSSDKLTDTVSAMYPSMTKVFFFDGKLYGLPVSLYCTTQGYYPKALEKVGLTAEDLPGTFDELLDFLRDWYYDYYDDYEDMRIFEWSEDLRNVLTNMIFQAQVLSCEAQGKDVTFRTATMQRLLSRLDSPEMKTVFDALSPKKDAGGNEVTIVYDGDDDASALLVSAYDPMPQTYGRWNPPEPLVLRLDEETEPALQTQVNLLTVNFASKNQDLAIMLLEYIADHMPIDVLTSMNPEMNDPIEVEYYQQNLSYMLKDLEAMKENHAKSTDPEEISEYQSTIEWYEQEIARMEREDRWAYSEEDIAYYREHIAPYVVLTDRSIFSGENNPAAELLMMYLDGKLDANSFISQIDDKVNMIRLENQ